MHTGQEVRKAPGVELPEPESSSADTAAFVRIGSADGRIVVCVLEADLGSAQVLEVVAAARFHAPAAVGAAEARCTACSWTHATVNVEVLKLLVVAVQSVAEPHRTRTG